MERYEHSRLLGGAKGESSVNQKLNNLRIKEIRRARNVARRGQLPEVARFTFNDPSLPTSVIAPSGSSAVSLSSTPRAAPRARVRSRAFGLVAPPSWENHFTNTANAADQRGELERGDGRELGWDNVRGMTLKDRWKAFAGGWSDESILLPPSPEGPEGPEGTSTMPSLFDVAVQALFTDPEWFCATVALLPAHILGRISRHACVYHPKVFYKHLEVDCYSEEPEGSELGQESRTVTFFELVAGAGGELNYVGDGRSGRPVRRYLEAYDEAVKTGETADSWDDSPPEPPPGLPNAIQPSLNPLVHIHLADVPVSTFLTVLPLLPPTLVRLAVISLPHTKDRITETVQADIPRCLRKLSKQLPLLEVLDVSYNTWFRLVEQIQTVEWSTVWSSLQTFIVRGLSGVDHIDKARVSRDEGAFGVLFVEDGEGDDATPPAVRDASMEINSKRKLGPFITLGY